jgi:hypothetical protein
MKFEFTEVITPELVELLEGTTLGTNGAMYRHLDVKDRIYQTDAPLSFSLKRNDHLCQALCLLVTLPVRE